MNINLDDAKLKKAISYEEQVREIIREKVLSGGFVAGEKIPSLRAIATSLGTNLGTVHNALNSLQSEGLLISYPRKGMFVRNRNEKLTCVGVYSGTSKKNSPYTQAVREALKEELHQTGIEMDLWMDTRPLDQQGEPWDPLIRAAEKRRFQAFIGIELDLPLLQWQQKLPVPQAFQGAPFTQNSVAFDLRQFTEISLRELVRQGCRSVALIAPYLTTSHPSNPKEGYIGRFDVLEHFTDMVAEFGLTIKNDWVRVVKEPSEHHRPSLERFGYEQFLKLWSQPEKPEGLLIFDDVVAPGVLMAIREKQVRVPEDLKLVLHKNESIDLFCPMPATFVISSEREMARALIEQVQKQFRGETCERISLPFKLEPHTNL